MAWVSHSARSQSEMFSIGFNSSDVTAHPWSRRFECGIGSDDAVDCLQGGLSSDSFCGDDGDGGGVEPRSPVRAEATGDFAEDDGGSQGAFGAVIGV
jgi:hypothetical protein